VKKRYHSENKSSYHTQHRELDKRINKLRFYITDRTDRRRDAVGQFAKKRWVHYSLLRYQFRRIGHQSALVQLFDCFVANLKIAMT
jgi:hypothetical protein